MAEIIRRRAAVTLVAPVCRAQGRWHRAVEACVAYEVLPRTEGVFTSGTRDTPAPSPKWEVAAFRFNGGGATRSPAYCGGSGSVTE